MSALPFAVPVELSSSARNASPGTGLNPERAGTMYDTEVSP